MATNERLSMERRLRNNIVTNGQEFFLYRQLNTDALLVITVDEDTRTINVVNVSEEITNKNNSSLNNSGETNQSISDQLEEKLKVSLKSTILETKEPGKTIDLFGIVTYKVDDDNCYVFRLQFNINKENRQGSSSSTSKINDKSMDKLVQNVDELSIQHEDDVSLDSSGHDDVSGPDMAEQNNVNSDSEYGVNEAFYTELGLEVNKEKDIACQDCTEICADIKIFQKHNRSRHKKYTCLVCCKLYALNKANVKSHIIKKHAPWHIECEHCKKKFQFDLLKQHIMSTHKNEITTTSSKEHKSTPKK